MAKALNLLTFAAKKRIMFTTPENLSLLQSIERALLLYAVGFCKLLLPPHPIIQLAADNDGTMRQ